MYRWTPIIEAQPNVQAAFAAHFRAVDEEVKWERKCKAIKGELAFLAKAGAEIEAQGLTLETWPKQATIWERIAESKEYCQNHGVRWHVRDERVTWDIKERYISDILGPEGAKYRAQLERELAQAEQQRRQAKEAEDRAMQALEAEREKFQWLVDYGCGEEVKAMCGKRKSSSKRSSKRSSSKRSGKRSGKRGGKRA